MRTDIQTIDLTRSPRCRHRPASVGAGVRARAGSKYAQSDFAEIRRRWCGWQTAPRGAERAWDRASEPATRGCAPATRPVRTFLWEEKHRPWCLGHTV